MNDWLLALAALAGFVAFNYAAWKIYWWLWDRREAKRTAELDEAIAKLRTHEDD